MKEEILFILENRTDPIKRRDLREALIGGGRKISDRRMRRTIEGMIKSDGALIESCPRGYYLIRDGIQLNRAMAFLNSYARQIAIRKNCLVKNWFAKQENKEKRKQYQFEFA